MIQGVNIEISRLVKEDARLACHSSSTRSLKQEKCLESEHGVDKIIRYLSESIEVWDRVYNTLEHRGGLNLVRDDINVIRTPEFVNTG